MATRPWGIAISGALIAAALYVAITAPPPRRASAVPPSAPAAAEPPAAAAPATLIVHFRGHGPLARAERARARVRVAAELRRQRAFRGACFERFDPRGVVLRSCSDAPLAAARLRAMRAVARVEPGE